jgi:hypothetical protein
MDSIDTKTPDEKPPEFDFETVYANNSLLELSVYDLKILFGQIEQHTGRTVVGWHTAVTMPWMQAKILSYFLRLQLSWYEKSYGSITVPENVRPPKPEIPADANPAAREYYEWAQKVHEEIFGA